MHSLKFCSPQKRKTNLISTLTHRALSICSLEKLQDELGTITSILLNNGYPEHVVKTSISNKIQQFNAPVKLSPEKYPIYLRLPFIGPISTKFEKQIKLQSKHALPLWNHVLFVPPKICVLQTRKMYFLPFDKEM